MASMKMASDEMPAHVLFINPKKAPKPDYLICYQCGFILRLFSNEPEHRKRFAANKKGRKAVEKIMSGSKGIGKKMNLPGNLLAQLRDQFFNGLMTQLRSYPIGLRIDNWILKEYPDLKELQYASINRQLQENTASLQPQVREMTPKKVFEANAAMNAAFAGFWARVFDQPLLTTPYRAIGVQDKADALLKIWDEIPVSPSEDYRLVDAWAKSLGIADWYEWLPYK